jgi:hypothetical protein
MRSVCVTLTFSQYQCVDIVALQSQGLLFGCMFNDGYGNMELAQVTAAAFLLNSPRCFKWATAKLIRGCSVPLENVFDGSTADIVPGNVLRESTG